MTPAAEKGVRHAFPAGTSGQEVGTHTLQSKAYTATRPKLTLPYKEVVGIPALLPAKSIILQQPDEEW